MSGPSITWAAEADFDRDDVYETDITSLITMPGQGIAIERGFDGSGNYLISKVSLDVNNNDGAFSQDNLSSARAGQLTPGVPLKLTATVSATPYSAWTGYIQKFQESGIGAGTVSMCRLDCTDLFTYLAESDLINITVSTSRDTDAALIAVMDAMGLTSGDRNFDDGLQDFPYHYALAQTALQAMLEAVKSEMGGRLFCNADGQLRFKARNAQLGTSVAATFGDVTGHYPVSISKATTNDEYVTAVRVRGTVFREGQADVEVFRFSRGMLNDTPDSLAIAAGDTYQRDFDTQSAVVAITAPVSSVDYLGNSAVDGSGTDKTSALTVTVTDRGAGRFNLKIKNTDASTVYVTLFRLRGQPTNFFADRPEAYFSLSVPGRKAGKVIELDVPYAGDTGQKLRDYAYTVLRTYRYAYSRLTLTFRPADDTEAARLLGLELGDRVAFRDTSLTINGSYSDDIYYIETIRLVAPANMVGNFTMALELVPSYLSRNLDALVFDLFDRANATGDLGTSTSLDVWANDANMDITSNTARANSDTAQIPDLDLGAGITDQVVEVSLAAIGAGDEVGVTCRKVDANNYYRAYVDKGSNEVILEKVVAAVVTELSSPAYTVGTTGEIKLMVQGSRLRVWVDRRLYIDTTDSSLTTGTKVGLFARNANATTTFANFYGQGL